MVEGLCRCVGGAGGVDGVGGAGGVGGVGWFAGWFAGWCAGWCALVGLLVGDGQKSTSRGSYVQVEESPAIVG